MNKSKMHTRLENTALKAMLERCVKQVDEKNARIRDFHAANSKLVKIADDLKKENEALQEIANGALGCFEAAVAEGWADALANQDIERITDLWTRRISFAHQYLLERPVAVVDSRSEWPGPVYNAIANQRPDWKPRDGYEIE